MDDFNVAARVQDLCKARSWSLYRLAKEAGRIHRSARSYIKQPHRLSLPSKGSALDLASRLHNSSLLKTNTRG